MRRERTPLESMIGQLPPTEAESVDRRRDRLDQAFRRSAAGFDLVLAHEHDESTRRFGNDDGSLVVRRHTHGIRLIVAVNVSNAAGSLSRHCRQSLGSRKRPCVISQRPQ